MTRPKCPHCGSTRTKVNSRKYNRMLCCNQECRRTWKVDVNDIPPVLPVPSAAKQDQPADPGVNMTNDNEGFATSETFRDPKDVPTVESVLAQFGVDEKVWAHDNALINRWEMGYTYIDKDKRKRPGHYPLYQVKIPLQRRVPIGVDWPVFRGAKVRKLPKYNFNISRGLKRILVMPDLQVGFRRSLDDNKLTPFHDPIACALFAAVVRDQRPDGLVSVGDNLDFTESTNKFLIQPEYYFTTQASLDWLASYLWQLRPWVGPQEHEDEFVYLEGNHEVRLPNIIAQNALFACRLRKADRDRLLIGKPSDDRGRPLLSVPGMLGLDDMMIKWVDGYPRNRWWVNDNLRVTHGEKLGAKSGQSVTKTLEAARCSMIFGHSHRLESAHVTVHARDKARVYGAYNVGTLCKIDGTVPSNAREENWQNGFAVVDYSTTGHQLHQVQLINMFGHHCMIEGKMYEPEDDLVIPAQLEEVML